MAKVFSFSKLAAITCGTLLLSNAAQAASLVGDVINLEVETGYNFTPSGLQTESVTVSNLVEAKIELPQAGITNAAWEVDVDASSFTLTTVDNGVCCGPQLTLSDLNFDGGQTITGVTVSGLDPTSILDFGVDFVTVDLGDVGWEPGKSVTYTLQTVPVPAAVWLFGSGLLGLIGIARRKAA